jgi:hypothetical protein
MSMDDDKTAEQSITDDRCALKKDLDSTKMYGLSPQLNKCQVVEDAVGIILRQSAD